VTRSQRKTPVTYTSVPVLVKIFKLIVAELNDILKEALETSQTTEDYEDNSDEWEDDEENGRTDLSKLLGMPGNCPY